MADRMILRPYQEDGIAGMRAAFAAGARAVCYVAPTGAGKTIEFVHIAQSVVARGKRVWITVHRAELLAQTSRALTALGVEHGHIAPETVLTKHPVQVASIQTLARRIGRGRLPHPPDLIILDECHHIASASWGKVVAGYPKARLLGVTATPMRLDGRGLRPPFDSLVLGPTTAALIEGGWLARPVVYAPKQIADLAGVHTAMGDYRRDEIGDRMDKPTITGDAMAHYKRLCDGLPAIAFCVSIAHAEHVASAFQAAGYRAASIDGTMSGRQRADRIGRLGAGGLHVLTSCELISEGVDVPVVTAAILLRPTQSLGLYRQQVGRVLRPAPGKDVAIILDHVGNVFRHGLPDDEPEWSLDGAKRRQKPEPALAVRTCPLCYTAHRPAPVCPTCGHVYAAKPREIVEVDGDLHQVDPDLVRSMRRSEIGRAKSREALEAIARERGYKSGWVEHIMRARERNGYHVPIPADRSGTISSWAGEPESIRGWLAREATGG